MTLCSELQQSHEIDYENGAHFAMNFIHDIWQTCILHRNVVTLDVNIKCFVVQSSYATWHVQIEKGILVC